MSNLTDIANLELVFDSRLKAKFLSWLGWRNANIAEALGENENTIASWKARDKWDKAMGDNRVEQALQIRLMTLVMKEKKNSGDYKELSELFKNYKEFVRLERYRDGGNEADLNPKVSERGKAKKRKANTFDDEAVEKLVLAFEESLFDYQRTWYQAGDERTRVILKSRQIGATWYFAREALVDAVTTGRNQIFYPPVKHKPIFLKNTSSSSPTLPVAWSCQATRSCCQMGQVSTSLARTPALHRVIMAILF